MPRSVHELAELEAAIRRTLADPSVDARTAKLLASGKTKIAKKVVEEASEVSFAYLYEDHDEIVREAVDLLYNLSVLLVASGVSLEEVYGEMESRRLLSGIAGKLPKAPAEAQILVDSK